ncbi:uncharacterized protein [Montipora foliosa]|uniref:uncharacterized protein n=1 Tax=Montipora foliosa TaxID=591990 RepID=UPI0035F20CCD
MSKDPSFPSISSCASQEGHEDKSGQAPTRKLKVTLLSSEWQSTKGGLSTIIRELAIQLAKHQNVEVSMYLPQCSEEDVRIAEGYHVKLVQARKLIGYEPSEWLSFAPENHEMDYVIGHGLILGRQVQLIQKQLKCKWVQVLHTAPEDLGMFKGYEYAISRAEEKTEAEIKLCELADKVVALGPKLADDYSRYLRHCQGDESVFALTPSIFSEFSPIKHAAEERMTFCVLVFGRGDTEDFELKGYDIAAKAISELKEESYQLIFVGAPLGREEEVAEKLCQRGIARRHLTVCSFKESRKDLNRLFCEVDLCIMPSRTEGFGLAALEALSAGLPILVSGNSGLGNALQNVPHGSSRVVNSEDPKEWAKAIKRVSEKKRDVRLEETQDLRTQYAKKYCWKEQCDKLLKMMFDSAFGTHHATEVEQDSSLSRKGKRPLNPSVTPLSKKQRHDTAAVADSEVVKLLREVYMRQAVFRPLLWNKEMKLHLHEVYTRLKIVLRPKGDGPSGGSEVDLSNIFGCNTGEDSMALAEGSPGIGKTTLCLKLAYDWANRAMPSTFPVFELVLLLKCRDLDGDIMEAIFEQLLPEDIDVKTKERLRNFITDFHNQERILIILDGLDELPEKSKHHVDQLLDGRILPFCYLLATTQQEKGIEARKQFAFDICLQVEGFSEEDSLRYIRKHFKNVDPSKGERLVEEIRDNSLLRALQNNPLHLLLLCVVYEDREGNLPFSHTDLYQIIVRCLWRRYCKEHRVMACEEDRDLEKHFEANILALGELAWECLLNDRHSFREDELKEIERSDDRFVVRFLALVYKEESLKRLKPQHECVFLHKSFQEYLAASYIAHKLRRNQFNVFEHVVFDKVVTKFPQLFLFLCGILREEANILFAQIGEKLERSNWDWLECSKEAADFFVESFSESGNPEQMAGVLFSFIPFPRVVHLSLFSFNDEQLNLSAHWNVVKVLRACSGFSKVQTPDVHIEMPRDIFFRTFRELQSLPKIKGLHISNSSVDAVFGEISNFSSLSELTPSSLDDFADWESAAEFLTNKRDLRESDVSSLE